MSTTLCLTASIATWCLASAPLHAQAAPQVCRGVLGVGSLTQQAGNLTIRTDTDGQPCYRFDAEPTVGNLFGNAARELRDGDVLVAIDGLPITSPEGGDRYSSLGAGEVVTLRVRRAGSLRTVTVTTMEHCYRQTGAPRETPEPGIVAIETARPPGRHTNAAVPVAYLGLAFRCTSCRMVESSAGERHWAFDSPPVITDVVPDGPAAGANLRRGWELHALNGHALGTPAGMREFNELAPGVRVEVTTRDPASGTYTVATLIPGSRPSLRREPS